MIAFQSMHYFCEVTVYNKFPLSAVTIFQWKLLKVRSHKPPSNKCYTSRQLQYDVGKLNVL